ncbi:hypothetical protein GCS91_14795 [Delftia tsuruhatensis]|nr:hypothetical protein GCS91_14795 [Delftia tsuruhatensis]
MAWSEGSPAPWPTNSPAASAIAGSHGATLLQITNRSGRGFRSACAAGGPDAPNGGYVNAETGEILLPEFAPTGGGFSRFVRIRHTPRRIEANGPFCWI